MLQLARYTGEEARSNQLVGGSATASSGPGHQQLGGPGHTKHQSGPLVPERDGPGHNMFIPKLDPPSGFSDALELTDPEYNEQQQQQHVDRAGQRNLRDFVIAV